MTGMFSALARGCPPGPFPGWCDATWATVNPTAPGGGFQGCQSQPSSGQLQPGVCYSFGPHAASWWTLPHFAALAAVAVLSCAAGLALAVVRDRLAARALGAGEEDR